MSMIIRENREKEGGIHMMHEHKDPAPHTPHPSPKKKRIEYEEQDLPLMAEIFGDEGSAGANLVVLEKAPYEQQMLCYQLYDLVRVLKEVC